MSQHRSGLVSGLIVGLLTAVVCAAGIGASSLYWERIPESVRTFGEGVPLLAALAFVAGVLIGWAIRLVRPRSLVLPPVSALYAAASALAGLIITVAMAPVTLFGSGPAGSPPALSFPTVDALVRTAQIFWPALYRSWHIPTILAAAALPAFALVLMRVRRLRKAAAAEPETTAAQDAEPEYRAPFEPLQAPKPATPPSLFTPPERGDA
jgi:hypothetical protein